MKLVYQAQNTIEAHMVSGFLEQEGIVTKVDGEYLQGGVGLLQAIDLIRVMVDDQDYDAAIKLVEEWDARQATESNTDSAE